jgi:hypothetical protein
VTYHDWCTIVCKKGIRNVSQSIHKYQYVVYRRSCNGYLEMCYQTRNSLPRISHTHEQIYGFILIVSSTNTSSGVYTPRKPLNHITNTLSFFILLSVFTLILVTSNSQTITILLTHRIGYFQTTVWVRTWLHLWQWNCGVALLEKNVFVVVGIPFGYPLLVYLAWPNMEKVQEGNPKK